MRKILISLILILPLALAGPALADLAGQELPLSASGLAYELNPDAQGLLWVTDFEAGEIWSIDPTDGSAAVYAVGGNPSDARRHGDMLYWGDTLTNAIMRMPVAGGNITTTTVTSASGFYGSGIDGNGSLWLTDITLSRLYNLDPLADNLCTYTLPDGMTSDYLVADGDFIWLGDKINERIARLQISNNDFLTWNLAPGSYPEGLALENPERLWWMDYYRWEAGVLDVTARTVTTYTLPVSKYPLMISLSQGLVWFSLEDFGFGVLDPIAAVGTTRSADPQPGELYPDDPCVKIKPEVTGSAMPVPVQAGWTDVIYPTRHKGGGWTIYELPADTKPWGIAALDEIWVVDQGRQMLVRTGAEVHAVYLPVILK